MFYIKEVTGPALQYTPGDLLRARKVEVAQALQAAVPSTSAPTSDLHPDALAERATSSPAPERSSRRSIQAYERAINPEETRKRIFKASELMKSGIVTIHDTAVLADAAQIFKERRFRHVPVVDHEGGLVGLLSDRDLLRRAAFPPPRSGGWEQELVRSTMSTPVLATSPDTEIREVAEVMIREHVGCLPVWDENLGLVGIITRSDILRTLLVQAPLELWS